MKMNTPLVLTTFFVLLFLSFSNWGWAQEKDSFILVNGKGKKAKLTKMKDDLDDFKLIFFGEEHDNVVAHQMTLELMRYLQDELNEDGASMSFALEMFERDQQACLDSLQNGLFSLTKLGEHTRLWSNYSTDYAPLLSFCLEENIPIIASNIPREYASFLFKNGREALKEKVGLDTAFLCDLGFPVDTTLSQYAALKEMAVHMNALNFIEAQAIKDATMARSIVEELQKGKVVFHLNGCYHSDYHQGILWYVQRRMKVKALTISVVSYDGEFVWDKKFKGKADYIFFISSEIEKSYQ